MRSVQFILSIFATFMTLAAAPALSQAPASQPLNISGDDAKRIEDLTARGGEVVGTKISIWFPSGLLTAAERKALVDRLDRGVTALRELVGTHEWQRLSPDQKLVMYIAWDEFPAHATGRGVVLLPAIRVREGNAPFLHELAHEFLAFRIAGLPADPETRAKIDPSRPNWLVEGLPEYLALTAGRTIGRQDGDVFKIGGFEGTDRSCAEGAASATGQQVLEYIGGLGAHPLLLTTQRMTVARTHYACSLSFTKHVIGKIGLPETVQLMNLQAKLQTNESGRIVLGNDGVLPRIESLTGQSMKTLKEDWLRKIRSP